jgi:hypothetical protein
MLERFLLSSGWVVGEAAIADYNRGDSLEQFCGMLRII